MKELSPSNMDDYIKVSTIPSKIILSALLIFSAGLIFWCFAGRIADKEHISGVVFPVEGATGVSVPNDGTVREIFVHKGDMVDEGQTLALVSVSGSYSIVSAPYSGKVLSFIAENDSFKAFEDIVDLLPGDACNSVHNMIAYADYNSSRMIKPGQEIQATPKSETRERVGFVRGRVTAVSPYPVNRKEAMAKLQNASLADEIFPKEGSAFEITIELLNDENSEDRLEWSFPNKELIDMSTGTFCNIEVITKSRSIFKYLLENVQETRNSVRLWAKN